MSTVQFRELVKDLEAGRLLEGVSSLWQAVEVDLSGFQSWFDDPPKLSQLSRSDQSF